MLARLTEKHVTSDLEGLLRLRTDNPGPGWRKRLARALERIRRDMAREFPEAELRDELETARRRVHAFTFDRWLGQVEDADLDDDRRDELVALGRLDPPARVSKKWDRENEALVASLTREHLQGVVDVIATVGATATAISVVKQATRERYGIVRRRARTIGDDQTEKLAGRIDEATQRRAGIDAYTWVTMGDDRVREEHEARNGLPFRWDDPPPDGHPGEPVNCRCSALPVF